MSTRQKGSVRMGPISLFALIILLSLAVLSVLAASTAQATYASATKQARFTTDTYSNEVAAQELIRSIDTELAHVQSKGGSRADALESLSLLLPEGAWIEGTTIHAQFLQESGRTLTIALEINDTLEYRVTQWQAITQWSTQEEGETLWSGVATEG